MLRMLFEHLTEHVFAVFVRVLSFLTVEGAMVHRTTGLPEVVDSRGHVHVLHIAVAAVLARLLCVAHQGTTTKGKVLVQCGAVQMCVVAQDHRYECPSRSGGMAPSFLQKVHRARIADYYWILFDSFCASRSIRYLFYGGLHLFAIRLVLADLCLDQ
uniref:Secreted protein n=1 Tax=Parascaris univalens TaxID=6257 RepID=A0A915BPY7_PARUN